MFDIAASIILVVSFAVLLVVFIRKQKNLSSILKKNSFLENNQEEDLSQLEVLDKKVNKLLEFFLRKIRTIILKSDNIISDWLYSLKKENGSELQEMFFIEEKIKKDGQIEVEETVVKIGKKSSKKENNK